MCNSACICQAVCPKLVYMKTFFILIGVKGNIQGNLFKIITQSDTHYFIQAPTHQDKMDWIDAIRDQT